MDFSVMLEQLVIGFGRSMEIFFFTLLISLPVGLLVALGRKSKIKLLSGFIGFLISVLRGTPLMLQLWVVYFFPNFVFGMSIADWRFPAIVVGFSINYAAYFAEIYRSGIEAVPKGQYEAAQILGYGKVQTFVKIILPQVIKIILPSITNEIITLVKDTSLAFTLSYLEMFSVAKQIAAKETTFMPFAIAAIFYYVFNLIVAFVMGRIEKKLNYYE